MRRGGEAIGSARYWALLSGNSFSGLLHHPMRLTLTAAALMALAGSVNAQLFKKENGVASINCTFAPGAIFQSGKM
jgi:hypothetical protein